MLLSSSTKKQNFQIVLNNELFARTHVPTKICVDQNNSSTVPCGTFTYVLEYPVYDIKHDSIFVEVTPTPEVIKDWLLNGTKWDISEIPYKSIKIYTTGSVVNEVVLDIERCEDDGFYLVSIGAEVQNLSFVYENDKNRIMNSLSVYRDIHSNEYTGGSLVDKSCNANHAIVVPEPHSSLNRIHLFDIQFVDTITTN